MPCVIFGRGTSTAEDQTISFETRRVAMFNRILGIITFKSSMYLTIAKDGAATRQAAILVAVAEFVQWLCFNMVTSLANGGGINFGGPILFLLIRIIFGLIVWLVTGWLLAVIANAFGGKTSSGEMLRVAGFVQVFGLLSIFGLVTLVSPSLTFLNILIAIAMIGLMLGGYFVGARKVANLSTHKAFITAFLVSVAGLFILFLLDRVGNAVVLGFLWRAGFLL
jgi:hypothetical protein